MSDEPTQDQDKVPEIELEPAAVEEAKPSKKPRVAKKKTAAESLPEQEPALEPVAEPTTSPAPEPVAELPTPPAPEPVAEPTVPPAPEPVATPEKIDQTERDDDLFQQGVQSLLRSEYAAADNFFGQALIVCRKNGDQAGQIDVLEQLGHVCYLRGAEAQAREYYRQAGLMRNA